MLELRNITKRFGAVTANDAVSIAIRPGTIHAVVGENGAGKSTAMKIAYGFYRPDSGSIAVDGRDVVISTPQDAIALGIGMVHQHFMLVDTMTVAENIILGAEPGSSMSLDIRKASEEIRRLSEEFRFSVDPDMMASDLSVGQQQRVELLKALYRRAKILILDEPTAVLTPQEIAELFAILRNMRSQGKTVVVITHKLAEVLAISDEVTVMRDGRVAGHVQTKDTNAAELARMMVGRDVLLRVEKTRANPGRPILSVENLVVKAAFGDDAVKGVSFSVKAGEIVGIAGVEGNGQTELIEALAGLTPRSRVNGSIDLEGIELVPLNARRRRELGLAHIPEDRHRRGLLLDFDLSENIILGDHHSAPIARGPGEMLLDGAAIRTRSEKIISDYDVRPPDMELPARALSGGNQQKLIIGRELELPPRLLLVSQPTRGVDIGAIEFIHRRLVAMRDSGCAILLVSAELEEVTALSDRLFIIHEGQFAGELDPATASFEDIGLLMTGGRANAKAEAHA